MDANTGASEYSTVIFLPKELDSGKDRREQAADAVFEQGGAANGLRVDEIDRNYFIDDANQGR